MVTTIKITCDGVFIQSNSFLSSTNSSTTTTPTSRTTTPTTIDNNKSKGNSLHFEHRIKSKSNISATTSTKSSTSSSSASASKREKQKQEKFKDNTTSIRTSPPRRYYFGNNNIYWCKETLGALNTTQKSDKKSAEPNFGIGKITSAITNGRKSCSITRSASSVTHKELQNTAGGGGTAPINSRRPRCKQQQLSNSLSAASSPTNPLTTTSTQPPKELNFLEKFTSTENPKSLVNSRKTKSNIGVECTLVNNRSTSSANGVKFNTTNAADNRLLNFLRSPRKLCDNNNCSSTRPTSGNGDSNANIKNYSENSPGTTKFKDIAENCVKKRLSPLSALEKTHAKPCGKNEKTKSDTNDEDVVLHIDEDWLG